MIEERLQAVSRPTYISHSPRQIPRQSSALHAKPTSGLQRLPAFPIRHHADRRCSSTTLRRRRDEWIDAGIMDRLETAAREGYDRLIGLDLADVAVDGCLTKAPCGGEVSVPEKFGVVAVVIHDEVKVLGCAPNRHLSVQTGRFGVSQQSVG